MFVYWNSGGNLSGNNFLLYGNQDSAENHTQILITKVSTAQNLIVHLTTAPTIGNKDRTFTIRLNGVDTALTVTIADGATDGTDAVNTVALVAGDLISIKHTITGAGGAPTASVGMASVQII
jgi:hypothetical protein